MTDKEKCIPLYSEENYVGVEFKGYSCSCCYYANIQKGMKHCPNCKKEIDWKKKL